MKNIIISLMLLLVSMLSAHSSTSFRPLMSIYTSNVENKFEVGDTANIFVEVQTEFEFPNGEAEIALDGYIVGFPPISLDVTKIGNAFFSFVSPVLTIDQVGERYFQVQLKIRSKKTANRLSKAIEKNAEKLIELISARDEASEEYERQEIEQKIAELKDLNVTLAAQLNNLWNPMGPPEELGIRIMPKMDESVSVILSDKYLVLSEEGTAEYSIKLSTRPTSDIFVQIKDESGVMQINDGVNTLIFTPDNYDREQSVKLYATETFIERRETLSHAVSSKDRHFDNLVAGEVFVLLPSEE